MNNIPADHEHIERIDLTGGETFEVTTGVRTIGEISLYRSDGISLPSTVRRIDKIELEQGRLDLPDSVQEVGYLEIYLSDSYLSHRGVEKFGNVHLLQADFDFADGVQQIASLDSTTSSVSFPSTLRRIGSIHFRHEYDDEDSIDWPDGTVEIGDIRMTGPTKIRVPQSVRSIGALDIGKGARLEIATNTSVTGECHVQDGGQLVRY